MALNIEWFRGLSPQARQSILDIYLETVQYHQSSNVVSTVNSGVFGETLASVSNIQVHPQGLALYSGAEWLRRVTCILPVGLKEEAGGIGGYRVTISMPAVILGNTGLEFTRPAVNTSAATILANMTAEDKEWTFRYINHTSTKANRKLRIFLHALVYQHHHPEVAVTNLGRGYDIDHLCGQRCINIDHLSYVPHLQNISRINCPGVMLQCTPTHVLGEVPCAHGHSNAAGPLTAHHERVNSSCRKVTFRFIPYLERAAAFQDFNSELKELVKGIEF
jgi:hypothetical protein